MIRADATELFAIYLLVLLAPIFGLWIASEMLRRSRERRAAKAFTQCAICGLLYPAAGRPEQCPRCGALNEHRRINII